MPIHIFIPLLFSLIAKYCYENLFMSIYFDIIYFSIISIFYTQPAFFKTIKWYLILTIIYILTFLPFVNNSLEFGMITIALKSISYTFLYLLYHKILTTESARKQWVLLSCPLLITSFLTSAFHNVFDWLFELRFMVSTILYLGIGFYMKDSYLKKGEYNIMLTYPLIFVLTLGMFLSGYRYIIDLNSLFAIGLGFFIYDKKWFKPALFLLLFVVYPLITIYGLSNLGAWQAHRVIATGAKTPKIGIIDAKTRVLTTEKELAGKVVLLDFWTTSCGVCFKKFKNLEDVYQKYKNNPNVKIIAVNLTHITHNDHRVDTDSIIQERIQRHVYDKGYSFSVGIADSVYSHYSQLFGITGVPHIVVLNKKSEITYTGYLHTSSFVKVDNIYDVMEKVLEEGY